MHMSDEVSVWIQVENCFKKNASKRNLLSVKRHIPVIFYNLELSFYVEKWVSWITLNFQPFPGLLF